MDAGTLLLFAATVLPLIATPGPDMLYVTAQAVSGGAAAGLRATAGICLGYVVHAALIALGLAAIIAASPVLFELLRWLGVGYLIWLACQLIRSALRSGRLVLAAGRGKAVLRGGFLTALLNPKGMMINFAILPQFMQHTGSIALQAASLSAIFIGLCGLVDCVLTAAIATIGRRGGFGDRRRRGVEGAAGGLLLIAAGLLAAH